MSKNSSSELSSNSASDSSFTHSTSTRAVRETIEALAIALVLAFFFKAFAAEAFVIPTGSMASTLMGRHKDVLCEQCGFPFQISASEESNDGSERVFDSRSSLPKVVAGTCPQCRFTMYVGPDDFQKRVNMSYSGDRIFVNKSVFDFREPSRWHVTVFRYPGKPQINYIKRLVGQANETVQIRHGDIFVKKQGEDNFTIQRKPLRSLMAMLRPVDDNDYVIAPLIKLGWTPRWFDTEDVWRTSDDFKSFRIEPSLSNDSKDSAVLDNLDNLNNINWLNYQNIVPSSEDWYYLSQEMLPENVNVRPQLITDFLSYNSGQSRRLPANDSTQQGNGITIREVAKSGEKQKEHFCSQYPFGIGLNWVGDLAISCQVTIERPGGKLFFRLIKGGETFVCEIDLTTGMCTLSIPKIPEFVPVSAPTPIAESKTFNVMFCNIDEQMRLVIDGKEIDFPKGACYDNLCENGGPMPRDRSPNRLDLNPAGIGANGASVKIEHLKIERDMYYIACDQFSSDTQCDLLRSPFRNDYFLTEESIFRVLSTPEMWDGFGKTRSVTLELGDDEFLMLGDNSAKSKDSRLWTVDGIPATVPRNLLIGEAVFVYWPHGFRIPGTQLPFVPNPGKMRLID
ncbi:MAG: S26 family signal peptidase [Thermoguttaceae bacterium]